MVAFHNGWAKRPEFSPTDEELGRWRRWRRMNGLNWMHQEQERFHTVITQDLPPHGSGIHPLPCFFEIFLGVFLIMHSRGLRR